MPKQSRNDETIGLNEGVIGKLPGQVVVVVLAGMTAGWIPAGSIGFLGHALSHALTCIALGVAVVVSLPWPFRTWKNWAIPAIGIIVGIALNNSLLPTVNILGIVLI